MMNKNMKQKKTKNKKHTRYFKQNKNYPKHVVVIKPQTAPKKNDGNSATFQLRQHRSTTLLSTTLVAMAPTTVN